MTPAGERGATSRAADEAAAWLARLRGPDGAAHHDAFERWYIADAQNGEAYDRLLDSWDDAALSAQTAAGATRTRLDRRGRTRIRASHLAIAASLALIVLAGIALPRLRDAAQPQPGERLLLASALGEIRDITLSDGSRVILDTQTRIREAFSGTERRLVVESGRARFEVAGDRRPFVVEAGGNNVTATGKFDLTLLGGTLAIASLSGEARIKAPDGAPAMGRTVRAGRSVAIASDGRVREAGLQATADPWPSGILSFDNSALDAVIAAINRYNNRPILLADPALATLRFTGTLRARRPEVAAATLAAAFGLEVAQGRRGEILLTRRAK